MEQPKDRGKSYNKWLGTKPPCHRDRLRMAIDAALARKPADLDALLAVLSGERTHTPRTKNVHRADPPKVNLLVDIQAKLRDGKGAGYARWASVFNLKQMAQTMNYLTEHSLLDYTDLVKKADGASTRYHDLSEKIKAAEKRMAEIAVMKTHIINYSKICDVYVAYRKAGYSKKFKAEHESEILLHQAAKKFFDESGLKKLPTVKGLQTKYAALLSEKSPPMPITEKRETR